MTCTVIILAAGNGTRMRSNKPKVLHQVAGAPMIEYLLDIANQIGSEDIRVVVNKDLAKQLEAKPLNVKINYHAVLQSKIDGTATAVWDAVEYKPLKNQVLILYGDSPLLEVETLKPMFEAKDNDENISLVSLGFYTEYPQGYGRMITVDDYLVDIVEEKSATAAQKEIKLCNSGVMLVNREVLQELLPKISSENSANEYYLTDIIGMANRNNYRCTFSIADELSVMGVNTQQQLAEVNFVVQARLRQGFMEKGVTMLDPNTVYLSKDTEIGVGVIIEPFVFIGGGVKISDNCIIRSHSYIEGANIGEGCSIGPFARLRSVTEVENNVSVGNFVEVKNSKLAEGTKVNHLSYLGDVDIGNECNIGAGTVICNYDGIKKHRTTIGDKVFVGSNSSIVAPLTVEDYGMIGAGSTITKDVKKDELAVTRVEQTNLAANGVKSRKIKK